MELFADYTSELGKDFKLNALVGTAIRKNRSEIATSNAGGLDLPDLFAMNNGRAVTAGNFLSRQEIQSLFGSAQLGYKDVLFLDVTGRNDWASTLPAENRSYFYPSVSVSAIISELVKLPDWWDFAKIRSSYAFVGKEAAPFSTVQTLQASQGVSGTILRNRAELVNPNLKPEQTRSFEIGGEFRFLDNRLSLDATYYVTNSFNQILRLDLPVSTGFNSKFVNAGQIKNNGLELLINAGIVRNKTFRWDLGLNFSTFRNEVVELDENLKTVFLSSTRVADVVAKEGDRFGDMYVNGFVRDSEGLVQIGANGLPTRTARTVKMGNVFPDWTGGINNSFTFGNFGLDFLIDGRFGGVVASHTQAVLGGLGKLPETLEGRESNNYIVPGVLAGTKTPNNIAINPRNYWQFVGGRGNPVGEQWVYDATNIRLRQATLNYKLPASLFTKSFIQSINVSLYGRNLFFFKNDAPFDPEVSLNSVLGGQGIDFYSLPTTRSYGFNVNVNF
jgi:outer membrane receptor protein involved in Fe transport